MSDHALATASSSINLSKSLIDFVPASGALINISHETYKWLVRERIDEGSFETCRDLARGLAHPNALGLEIREQIEKADRRVGHKIKLPLPLVQSGALGRLLAGDPESCYMVSTVAALTHFHAPDRAAEVLCSMILDEGGHSKGTNYRYEVQRFPIKAVISKIVNSIYLNVVNVGHSVATLPQELAGLHQHLLEHRTFAGIVMGIQRSTEDIVIRSDAFLADLTTWLLAHFHGKLEVVSERKIIYERYLGGQDQSVCMMIEQRCVADRKLCNLVNTVEAMVSVAGSLKTFLQGRDEGDTVPISYQRQALYEVGETFQTEAWLNWQFLNRKEMLNCKHVAKEIMIWLLALYVRPEPSLDGRVGYHVDLDQEEVLGTLRLGDLMKHSPGLVNMPTGIRDETGFTFNPGDPELDNADSGLEPEDFMLRNRTSRLSKAEHAFGAFPTVDVLLSNIGPGCGCHECHKSNTQKQPGITGLGLCKPGCKRRAAVMLVSTLLCHGICDAFGVTNVSGRADVASQAEAVIAILSDIIDERTVTWDTWFALIVCTAAAGPGVSYAAFREERGEGCSAWAAVQHGSYILTAPWVDIATNATVRGCFAVTAMEGNIRNVADDVAFLKLESASVGRPVHIGEGPKGAAYAEEANSNDSDGPDWHMIVSDTMIYDTLKSAAGVAIFRTDEHLYRIMTTVRAGSSIRIVDPSLVLMGRATSSVTICEHAPDSQQPCVEPVRVDEFDAILETWETAELDRRYVRASRAIDCDTKINAILGVLGVATASVVVRRVDRCCLACAVDIARSRSKDERSQPYILNVCNPSTWVRDPHKREMTGV